MLVRVVFVWVSLRGTDMGLLYVPVCSYSCVYSWECMQVQGMLPSPPHPPTPTQRYVCVYNWECVQVQGMLPSPPHPPTHPNPKVCVCVQLGVYASPRYVTIPTPPTPHPKGMCVWMCVQMSPQKHVVCTDESDLCAQMRLLGCVYRWVKSVCADESSPQWQLTLSCPACRVMALNVAESQCMVRWTEAFLVFLNQVVDTTSWHNRAWGYKLWVSWVPARSLPTSMESANVNFLVKKVRLDRYRK